jgi:hypothetical protein
MAPIFVRKHEPPRNPNETGPTVPFAMPYELEEYGFTDTFMSYAGLAAYEASAYATNDPSFWFYANNVASVGVPLALTPTNPAAPCNLDLPFYPATPATGVWMRVRARYEGLAGATDGELLKLTASDAAGNTFGNARLDVVDGAPQLWLSGQAFTPAMSPVVDIVTGAAAGTDGVDVDLVAFIGHTDAGDGMQVCAVAAPSNVVRQASAVTALASGPGVVPDPLALVVMSVMRQSATLGTEQVSRWDVQVGTLADNPFGITLP